DLGHLVGNLIDVESQLSSILRADVRYVDFRKSYKMKAHALHVSARPDRPSGKRPSQDGSEAQMIFLGQQGSGTGRKLLPTPDALSAPALSPFAAVAPLVNSRDVSCKASKETASVVSSVIGGPRTKRTDPCSATARSSSGDQASGSTRSQAAAKARSILSS